VSEDARELNLTQRVLMLLEVNYSPQENKTIPLGAGYVAAVLGVDDEEAEDELEFLWSINVVRKDCDLYSLWP
jgi:hypothetical protein